LKGQKRSHKHFVHSRRRDKLTVSESYKKQSRLMARWRASGRLTASEIQVCSGVFAEVVDETGELAANLEAVTTDGVLVMGDEERMVRSRQLNRKISEVSNMVGE
jgi:hypothetical protein